MVAQASRLSDSATRRILSLPASLRLQPIKSCLRDEAPIFNRLGESLNQ
jgi:hypothetical protein